MVLNDKLAKCTDSFSVNMCDNGFVLEITGRNRNEDWVTAKILCHNLEELTAVIQQAVTMERD